MEMMELYPQMQVEELGIGRKNNNENVRYLFNPKTNRGYSVEGLAALFCKELDGKKKLKHLIKDFEKTHELESGKFDTEIINLIKDLSKNNLIVLNESPRE